MSSIAFVGLGNMGGPMAANLARAGHDVHGFDLIAEQRESAAHENILIAESAPEAAVAADVVITMLPAGRDVLSVWSEMIPRAGSDALFIDSSTIDVDSARKAHELARAAGLGSIDAPVSGGTAGAKAGTLTFMCGGTEGAFKAARPLLERMGKRVVHCGGPGSGQAAKICNNMILGASMIVTAEAFVLAEKLGLSHEALFEVASSSSGQCWSLTNYCPVPGLVPGSPANNSYKPGFATALMLKDLKLAQEAALASGASVPLGSAAAQLYSLFSAAGHGGEDFSGIINFLRGAGVRAKPSGT